jgi:hypothetical protein
MCVIADVVTVTVPAVDVLRVIGTRVDKNGHDDSCIDFVVAVFPKFFSETFHHA